MNNYHFLVSEREQGRYDEYMRRGLIGLKLNEWIEVYQYHLEHPEDALEKWKKNNRQNVVAENTLLKGEKQKRLREKAAQNNQISEITSLLVKKTFKNLHISEKRSTFTAKKCY